MKISASILALLIAAFYLLSTYTGRVAPITKSVVTPNDKSVYAPVDVKMELQQVAEHT